MAQSTGIILAVGGITIANRVVFNSKPWDWKPLIATGLAATLFAGAETVIGPALPRGIATAALITITFGRVDRSVPSPAESALKWFAER